jgi:hypothetical protein
MLEIHLQDIQQIRQGPFRMQDLRQVGLIFIIRALMHLHWCLQTKCLPPKDPRNSSDGEKSG